MLSDNERAILTFLLEAEQQREPIKYLGGFGGAHLERADGPKGLRCSPRELARLEQQGYIQRISRGTLVYISITAEGKAQL